MPKFKPGQSGNPAGKPVTGLDVLPEGWEDKINEAAEQGASMLELRILLGLKNTTFYQMQEREPSFKEAIDHARDLSEIWFERQGRAMIAGAPGNAKVWEKNMQNRFGWHDKVAVDFRTPDGIEVKHRHTLDDFYAKS